ncbi:MAG: GyrI-like domain-containing protein, partial [Acidimicrobiia bacterium]|nr:GyrI-like domain-containing protein [Acidimicrobiia bacterium]
MEKTDFKKTLRHLYQPTVKDFSLVEVPAMQFVMTDGSGSPAEGDYADAMSWLYSAAYSVKFASKLDLGRDYTVMPLEGLWWAEHMDAFATDDKDAWLWTAMIMQPDWIPEHMFRAAVTKSADKLGDP